MSKKIRLRFAPSEGEQWTAWQKRLSCIVVLSCLLAPRSGSKRSRLRTAFYIDLWSLAAGEETPSYIRTFIVDRMLKRASDLLDLSRLHDYRERLYIDKDIHQSKATNYISSIVTVGLIVKVLASDAGKSDGRKVSKAREFIEDNYSAGGIIRRNQDDLADAWRKWGPVAHLCAALVDFLQRKSTLVLQQGDWDRLESLIPDFLATAVYYQRFLLGEITLHGRPISRKTTNAVNLLLIPPVPLGKPFALSTLPEWSRTSSAEPR